MRILNNEDLRAELVRELRDAKEELEAFCANEARLIAKDSPAFLLAPRRYNRAHEALRMFDEKARLLFPIREKVVP